MGRLRLSATRFSGRTTLMRALRRISKVSKVSTASQCRRRRFTPRHDVPQKKGASSLSTPDTMAQHPQHADAPATQARADFLGSGSGGIVMRLSDGSVVKWAKYKQRAQLEHERRLLESLQEGGHFIRTRGITVMATEYSVPTHAGLVMDFGGRSLFDVMAPDAQDIATRDLTSWRHDPRVDSFLKSSIRGMQRVQLKEAVDPTWHDDAWTILQALDLGPNDVTLHDLHQQMVRAVSFMHSRNIVHLDMKLENMVVDGAGMLRLIDFGHSEMLHGWEWWGTSLKEFKGSKSYVCPEILKGQRYNGVHADLWSLGICSFGLWFRRFPWEVACATRDILFAEYDRLTATRPSEAFSLLYEDRFFWEPMPAWMVRILDSTLWIVPSKRQLQAVPMCTMENVSEDEQQSSCSRRVSLVSAS